MNYHAPWHTLEEIEARMDNESYPAVPEVPQDVLDKTINRCLEALEVERLRNTLPKESPIIQKFIAWVKRPISRRSNIK